MQGVSGDVSSADSVFADSTGVSAVSVSASAGHQIKATTHPIFAIRNISRATTPIKNRRYHLLAYIAHRSGSGKTSHAKSTY